MDFILVNKPYLGGLEGFLHRKLGRLTEISKKFYLEGEV